MDYLNEHGPSEHAWNQVVPGTAEEQARDHEERVEIERDIEQGDLDTNSHLLQEQHSTPLLLRYTVETSRDLLSPDENATSAMALLIMY